MSTAPCPDSSYRSFARQLLRYRIAQPLKSWGVRWPRQILNPTIRQLLKAQLWITKLKLPLTGENVLSLLRRATELADGNSRYAVEIAQRMSDELWVAQKRVAELQARVTELEAEVQLYRDKSDRAEAWLGKISSEIQERVSW